MSTRWTTVDGNDACAAIAHQLSDVIAIYPITPSSSMAEAADAWAASGRPNLWGVVPTVVALVDQARHHIAKRMALDRELARAQ